MSVVAERLADRASKLRETAATPRTALLTLGLVTLISALVRFVGLSRQSMWVDEGSTIAFTQRGLDGMLNLLLDYESNAFVYYLLVYPVTLIDGGLAPLRALSAVAGVCSIPALYWAARTIIPRRALLIACGCLSLNAFAITQSQYARAYALVLLMTIVSYGLLIRASAGGTRRHWWLYVGATALVVYLNSLCGLLLVAAQVFVPLGDGARAFRRWLLAVAGIGLAAAPLAALTLHAASGRDPFYWVKQPGLFDLARTQVLILGGPVAAVCTAALFACVLVRARHRIPRTRDALLSRPAAPVAAWAFVPIAALFALSLAKPVFSDQYLTPAVPGLCLAVGLAVASLPRRAGLYALGIIAVSLALGVADHARRQYFEDWRSPIRQLAHLRAPADPVIFDTQLGLVPAGYYDPAFTSRDGRLYVSEWHDGDVPAGVSMLGNPGSESGVPNGPPGVSQVQRLSGRTGNLFLVLSHTTGQGDILHAPGLRWLEKNCDTAVHRYKAVTLVAATACPK